jgi:hypothetical protein
MVPDVSEVLSSSVLKVKQSKFFCEIVHTELLMKIQVFWDMTLYRPRMFSDVSEERSASILSVM